MSCACGIGGFDHSADCPANQKEVAVISKEEERSERLFVPSAAQPAVDPKITVSIPVRIGGHTGQRDQYESRVREYKVTPGEEGSIRLTALMNSGQPEHIEVPWDTLVKAVALVRPPAPPNPPVYRNAR